jgi:hypothetical protein
VSLHTDVVREETATGEERCQREKLQRRGFACRVSEDRALELFVSRRAADIDGLS